VKAIDYCSEFTTRVGPKNPEGVLKI